MVRTSDSDPSCKQGLTPFVSCLAITIIIIIIIIIKEWASKNVSHFKFRFLRSNESTAGAFKTKYEQEIKAATIWRNISSTEKTPNLGPLMCCKATLTKYSIYVPYLSFFSRWSNIRTFQSIFLNKREVVIFSLKKAGENGISIFKTREKN